MVIRSACIQWYVYMYMVKVGTCIENVEIFHPVRVASGLGIEHLIFRVY